MNIKAKGQKYLDKWKESSKNSINRQIFAATIIVGLLTGFGKFASVAKELVVAWKFGTGNELDAFVMALVIPSFITNVIANPIKLALIPVYIKVKEQEGKSVAQNLLLGVMIRAIILLAITTIAVAVTSPLYLPLLASGFSAEKLELTNNLLWFISPSILLFGIISIWGGILNAGEKFALAAVSPIITPLVTVIILLAIPSWGIYTLVGGLILGSLVEMIIVGIGLFRQGIFRQLHWPKYDRNVELVKQQYLPVITGAFLMSSTTLVDQSMAAMLSPGSIAALGYANRVIALPLTLITLALGTAVVPYFSKVIAQKDWRKIDRTFKYYLKLIFLTTVPLTILFILASKLIVRLLFERGSFTAEDTQLVSQIQIYYALQIPFYVAAIFVVRLINSLGVNHFLTWGSSISLIVNVVANYAFVQWIGVKGIALSTSCVYLISFIFLYVLTNKYVRQISSQT